MTVSALPTRRHPSLGGHRRPSQEKIAQAQQAAARARRLQGQRISEHVISVLPALAALLPDNGLRPGCSYGIDGSTSLTAALMAGPSSDGLWCAVVGMPGFSAEAAAGLGCDLDHVVFVPHPGRDWVNVVAALIDALSVVVVRPPTAVSDAEAARLGARLRQHESVLIACGRWPRTETRLSVSESRWTGLGSGHGHLTARQATIKVSGRGAVRSSGRDRWGGPDTALWLPDSSGQVRLVEENQPSTGLSVSRDGELREAAG
jgi:hypothetical protein